MQFEVLAKAILLSVGLCTLVACSPRADAVPSAILSGPDEFSIVPPKSLESPDNFAQLPVPTPGGSNLTDQNPKADAIVALGGRVSSASGVDGDIVTYASRFGVDGDIRADLAKKDARKGSGLSFPWSQNRYEKSYRRFALDPWAEALRLQALGIQTPQTIPQN